MKKRPTTASQTTPDISLSEFTALDQRETQLRQTIDRLSRQLAKAKDTSKDLVDALYRAATDAASGITIPSIPRPILDSKNGKDEEVAVICVGDLQLGKVTPSYNSAICEKRMELYAKKVGSLTKVQRSDHPVRRARVYLLGDLVEGENIFSHQAWQLDASLFQQVMLDGPRILVNFIRSLLTIFESIEIACVIGNHGRLGEYRSSYNPESNMDRFLYFMVRNLFQDEKRVTWNIPYEKNERAFYAVDYPFRDGKGIMLFHGDQIRGGFAGFPFYGLAKKIWGWRAGAIPERFDIAVFGHWHTPTMVTLNSVTAYGNGSTESTNTFAREQLAACGEPKQLMFFMRPERITAEYWVDLLTD